MFTMDAHNLALNMLQIVCFLQSKQVSKIVLLLPRLQKKKPVDFDDELKIGDIRYDNITKITIKVQLF